MSKKKNPQRELGDLSRVVNKYSCVFEKVEIVHTSSTRRVRVLFAKKNNSNGKPEIAQAQKVKQEDRIVVITSPCVGFLTKTFVKTGDIVKNEQVLCVIEEVGIPFKVAAIVAGKIIEMFPDDAEATGYGEVLFSIKISE